MSLKAKLEAVIYAAEEPVTLTQLAQIFSADALEWQAAQAAAAAEANADVVGERTEVPEPGPLLAQDLEILPVADTAAMAAEAAAQSATAALTDPVSGDEASEGEPEAADAGVPSETPAAGDEEGTTPAESGEIADPEAEARRLARQRDREIKAILKQILDEIMAGYENDERGIEIREIAGGYRMATKPECHDAVRLFVKSLKPPLKLSLPALETLAVVAYKQPVTAPEVSEIRGVESGGVLGSLLARKLIATAGRKQVIGRPILYKTTKEFLLRFGLKDLNELPSMEEFEKMAAAEIEELEPEAVAADAAQAALEAAEASEPGGEAGLEVGVEAALTAGADEEPDQTGPEPQAELAATNAGPELEDNSPSGVELAGTQPADPPCPPDAAQASPESSESPTDATSAEPPVPSNEQDAEHEEASDAPPAEPEPTAPAENEAHPHAQKVEEEHGA
jgi:segregation and condensation protein B